jgi:acyl-CoA synthetase (AMP-forming)/AMP-acid ligase II
MAVVAAADMPDFLTVYASSRPGKLAVVDDRPGAGAVAWTYAWRHLGGYKCPRSVSFAVDLPRTGSGKLLKRELRAPYWAGQAKRVS